MFWTADAALALSAVVAPKAAKAASAPSKEDLEKVCKGHARARYLLENWDAETQICGKIIMSDTERKQIVRKEGENETMPMNKILYFSIVFNC